MTGFLAPSFTVNTSGYAGSWGKMAMDIAMTGVCCSLLPASNLVHNSPRRHYISNQEWSNLNSQPLKTLSERNQAAFSVRGASTSTRRSVLVKAVSGSAVQEIVEAKREIDDVLSRGSKDGLSTVSWALYADEETKSVLGKAVATLGNQLGRDFGEFLRSKDGHGVWEVFYAPHISRLSSAVGTRISPLQYKLTDLGITSNVRYLSPVGDGWLSSAGDFVVKDGKTVEVLFDSFWWDVGRDNLQPDPKGQGSLERTLVNFAGKGAFIAPLSTYPVHYADSDFVIFEFTTLRTKIAARRIDSAT